MFDPQKLERITIFQGLDDGKPHRVYIDEITIGDAPPSSAKDPAAPSGLAAKGYDRHIDLTWGPVQESDLQFYKIYRSLDGTTFTPLATQRGDRTRFEDFLGESGKSASYKVSAVNSSTKSLRFPKRSGAARAP